MTSPGTPRSRSSAWIAAGVLGLLLLILFHQSFQPGYVLFANDGPLGMLVAQADIVWTNFRAYWQDANWIGVAMPAGSPSISPLLYASLGPVAFAKFHGPLSLLILGLSAWYCLRRLGGEPVVALLGGIAAALNSNLLSHACWGLPPRAVAVGCILVAIGLLSGPGRPSWARILLAGFAVGLNVMEAADTGALLSLYVSAYLLWRCFSNPEPGRTGRLAWGGAQLAVIAVAAAWIAASAIHTLVSTSVKGVAVFESRQSTAERWDFVTGWSFPKAETLRLAVPGLFGYRMDTPEGGAYWGAVGPDGNPANRFSGGGEYAGLLVLLVAAWAVARSLDRRSGPFSEADRRLVWFWAVAAGLSLVFAYGRHAAFYHLLFPLPFFKTMRIPMKFLHGFHLSAIILFGYGLQALLQEHLRGRSPRLGGMVDAVKAWWTAAPAMERRFGAGVAGAAAAGLAGSLIYASYRPTLIRHLQGLGFEGNLATAVASFSFHEALLAAGLLVVGAVFLLLVLSGWFSGRRARTAGWVFGILLALDLLRANTPWVVHYNYARRYQANPVVNLLKERAFEGRVAFRMLPTTRQLLTAPNDTLMPAVHNLWLEHHFQYYNVQTVDIIQAPRMPALDQAFLRNFEPTTNELATGNLHSIGRLWQLTNTRYLMAARPYEGQLNSAFAAPGGRFTPRLAFELNLKPDADRERLQPDDFDAATKADGPYAIFEYTGALPRVGLYTRWEVSTNDTATLARLRDESFDPTRTVLLDADPGLPAAGTGSGGTARIESYQPKHVTVKANATTPAVLLFNDRWHESWQATVDGKPVPVLRANHLMRGVVVPAGEHVVEFRFAPPAQPLYVTVSALVVAVGLAGFLAWQGRSPAATGSTSGTAPGAGSGNPRPGAPKA